MPKTPAQERSVALLQSRETAIPPPGERNQWSSAALVLYGVIPQIIPAVLAVTIYWWDHNLRMSTVISLVGGCRTCPVTVNVATSRMWMGMSADPPTTMLARSSGRSTSAFTRRL